MICIAYLSSATSVPEPAELESILAASRRNNAAAGVTGLLCHHEGSFLQFLEGEADAVDAVYARISNDRRHRSVLRLFRRPIASRLFPHWTMALVQPDAIGPEHGPFCQGLRELQVGVSDEHAASVTPILTAFRAWLR